MLVCEAGIPLLRIWYGGEMDTDGRGVGSIQIASKWVRLVVGAGNHGQDPLAAGDEVWAQ
ncbi:hypothetical protein ColLi_02720 [Colletotrichum liriopes]|uniref:Uncharacterized protein n=1 Tax=Colletotrichum liriopes TaxID=708192 RepID=A0AA37GFT0_9PEZI|nr:hypothetical protein ColLi_02720 [Colletotrichum liriopes]